MTSAAPMDRPFDTFPKLLVENARICSDALASREKDFGIWLPRTWSEVAGEVRDVEAIADGPTALTSEVAQTIEAVCKLKGEVDFTEPGNLPNDGKVIADIRDHD